MIEAAGGVVWRAGKGGRLEVLLIHTRRDGEWELPKGKRTRRESLVECALREVHEETGLRCTFGGVLGGTRYVDRKGRPKTVTYWMMREVGGRVRRSREADKVMWVGLAEAGALLAKARDVAIVGALPQALMRSLDGSYNGRIEAIAG